MLKRFVFRLTCATVAFVVVFWLCRFGTWANSLTTVRTPLYFTIGKIAAWVMGSVAALGAYLNAE